MIDPAASFYTTKRFTPLAYLVGGGLFGFGMVLASGCGSKTLVRVGGGNLKSLVVLVVLAVSAYATMRGVLAVARAVSETRKPGNLVGRMSRPGGRGAVRAPRKVRTPQSKVVGNTHPG